MRRAVIRTGGKQYVVKQGQILDVELLKAKEGSTVDLETLAIIDGKDSVFGAPTLKESAAAKVLNPDYQGTKVVSIRFKAKKRVNKKRGHRQRYSRIEITKF